MRPSCASSAARAPASACAALIERIKRRRALGDVATRNRRPSASTSARDCRGARAIRSTSASRGCGAAFPPAQPAQQPPGQSRRRRPICAACNRPLAASFALPACPSPASASLHTPRPPMSSARSPHTSRVIRTAKSVSITSNSLQASCTPGCQRQVFAMRPLRLDQLTRLSPSRLRTLKSRTGTETSSSTGSRPPANWPEPAPRSCGSAEPAPWPGRRPALAALGRRRG